MQILVNVSNTWLYAVCISSVECNGWRVGDYADIRSVEKSTGKHSPPPDSDVARQFWTHPTAAILDEIQNGISAVITVVYAQNAAFALFFIAFERVAPRRIVSPLRAPKHDARRTTTAICETAFHASPHTLLNQYNNVLCLFVFQS